MDDDPKPQPVKPGFRTTEFWLHLAAVLLSALFASGALTNDRVLAIAGVAASVLTALGYGVQRSAIKRAGSDA